LQLGYHTHAIDLKIFGKRSAFGILIGSTESNWVVFAELGAGIIDWKELLQVAARGNMKHFCGA
jgi:hypothetical protein